MAGIDLNLLTPLAALLEERHVSRAARRAGLSQPAMSRALARMREAFGDELLVRGTHGYELTQRAEQLRQELETLLPRIEALVNGQVFDPATATTTFRITATDAATTILGPVVAARLRAVAPNVTLAFQAWNDHVIDDLERGRTDIVFRAVDAPAAMRSAHLVDDEFVCLLSAEHPLSERKRLALDEYLSCVHLEVNLGESGQFVIETRLAALGSARVVAVSIPYHAAAIAAVRGTDLVATLPRRLAAQHASDHALRLVAAPPEIDPLRFGMVWHPRLDDDPAHEWLRSTILAAAQTLDPRP